MNSEDDYPTHDNPSNDVGKFVETLNKYLNKDLASPAGLNDMYANPLKIIRGRLNNDYLGEATLFHIGDIGRGKSSQDRIIGTPYRYKIIDSQTGGRKSRMRRKRRNTRRRLRAA